MTVDELHDVMAERLDGIRGLIEKQNGRVGKLEDDLNKHKTSDAYRMGLFTGGILVASFAWEAIRRKLGW